MSGAEIPVKTTIEQAPDGTTVLIQFAMHPNPGLDIGWAGGA